MLNRKYRLSASQFPKVYKNGYKARGVLGTLIGLKVVSPYPLFGYVVSKKVGNSVQRHKMTRRLRNISMEMIKAHSPVNFSFQYISYKYSDDYNLLRDEFEKQILQILKG